MLGVHLRGELLTMLIARSQYSENWKEERHISSLILKSALKRMSTSATQTNMISLQWDSVMLEARPWSLVKLHLRTSEFWKDSGFSLDRLKSLLTMASLTW